MKKPKEISYDDILKSINFPLASLILFRCGMVNDHLKQSQIFQDSLPKISSDPLTLTNKEKPFLFPIISKKLTVKMFDSLRSAHYSLLSICKNLSKEKPFHLIVEQEKEFIGSNNLNNGYYVIKKAVEKDENVSYFMFFECFNQQFTKISLLVDKLEPELLKLL